MSRRIPTHPPPVTLTVSGVTKDERSAQRRFGHAFGGDAGDDGELQTFDVQQVQLVEVERHEAARHQRVSARRIDVDWGGVDEVAVAVLDRRVGIMVDAGEDKIEGSSVHLDLDNDVVIALEI